MSMSNPPGDSSQRIVLPGVKRTIAVALQGDLGEPIVHSHPDSPIAQAYLTLASAVKAQVEAMQSELAELPTLEIK